MTNIQRTTALGSLEQEVFNKLQENLKALKENEDTFKIAYCEAKAKASQESSVESFLVSVVGDQRSATQLLTSLDKLDASSLGDVRDPIKNMQAILAEAQICDLKVMRQTAEGRKYVQELKVKVKDFIE